MLPLDQRTVVQYIITGIIWIIIIIIITVTITTASFPTTSYIVIICYWDNTVMLD